MPEFLGYQYDRLYAAPIERYRQVSTIAERDAIPVGKRWMGMLCYVTSEAQDYQLDGGTTNLDWINSGSGDYFDFNAHTSDDITEGIVNLFKTTIDKTKLDHITVTNDINLDDLRTDVDALGGGVRFIDEWDASSGSFPSSTLSGDLYIVNVSGTVDGVSFALGDGLISKLDNASTSTFAGNWIKTESVSDVTSVVGLQGAITKSQLLSVLNVEDGATSDQTALEIESLLDTYYADTDWRTQLPKEVVQDYVAEFLNSGTTSQIEITYNDTANTLDITVLPSIIIHATLSWIVAIEPSGTLNDRQLYEITDASGFTSVGSGRAWVRWLGTSNGNETDYIIVSKEESSGGTGGSGSTKESFTSTSGQTLFVLSESPDNVDVIVNRVPQILGTDFTFTGNTVTMLNGVSLGKKVDIRKFSASSTKDIFTATTGQTEFILSSTPSNIDVVINRVVQIEGDDYVLSGNIVTMTNGVTLGRKVEIRKFN